MTWIALVLAILILSPIVAHQLRKPVNEAARLRAPGAFAALSDGQTHYQWDGPKDGRVMVCIHGLTTAGYVWDALVPELTRMGFRVLRYDLFGRGVSDAPRGPQDAAFFLRQLQDLLADQQVDGPVSVMGYSMGGAIATAWAAQNPDRVEALYLVAPAGLGRVGTPFTRFCSDVPVLGDGAMHALGGIMLRHGFRQAAKAVPGQALLDRQMAETRVRGFLPAVLSSYRNILADDQTALHEQIAARNIPVLAVWGGADAVIPSTSPGRLALINRAARQVSVDDATHALPASHATDIRVAIQAFLRHG